MIAAALVAGATLGAAWAALPYAPGYRCLRRHDWTEWRPESTTYLTSVNQDYFGAEVVDSRVCLRCGVPESRSRFVPPEPRRPGR